jgi:hypothetical protein
VTAPGPYELRPFFTGEDATIVATLDGAGSIAGQTFAFDLFNPDGTAVSSGLAVSITDAAARQVTAVISGVDLAAGDYPWAIRRTDTGSRTVSSYGVLIVRETH